MAMYNDYGANAVGEAIGGLLKGLQAGQETSMRRDELAENRKFRQMELDARLKSDAETRARQATIDDYTRKKDQRDYLSKLRDQGFKVPALEEGQSAFDVDPSKLEWDKESPKYVAAKASQLRAENGYGSGQMIDLRKDKMDRGEHERVLSRLSNNTLARQKLTQYQNLDNALTQVVSAEHLTPQAISEFQQAVRANLGIKGGSGVGEREATQIKTLGLNAEAFKQFLTGDPATLSKDTKLMDHLRDLANVEQNNIRAQYQKSLNAATGGHASMYSRRPDLKQDLDDAIKGYSNQISPIEQQSKQEGEPSAGLMDQEKPGLLDRGKGFLMSPANPSPNQDMEAKKARLAELLRKQAAGGQVADGSK